MHELSVIANLYEIMEEKAKEQGAKKITRVKLQVGVLSGVVPDFLETAFDIFKDDTMAAEAVLEIERVPLKILCMTCGLEKTSDGLIYICPKCGSNQIKNLAGTELILEKMDIEQDNFETRSTCPVCSGSALTPFKQRTFETRKFDAESIKITDSEYGKTWDLSLCQNCSFVFANPMPTPGFLQTLYSQVEDPTYEDEAEGRSKNFSRILSRCEKICPQKGPLFDVGAATGILVRLARDRGWDAEGIEPSAWAVKYAREKYGVDIKQGAFEKASLPSDFYAVVTMVDIVEHMAHPLEAVQKAFEILKPGGIVCLVTPDIKSLAARLMGAKWWHYRPGHLGYFAAQSLQKLLERTGFTIVKKKKYVWTFSAHYLISRKKGLRFLIKNARLALFWKKISIKLALSDSMEIYATKDGGV